MSVHSNNSQSNNQPQQQQQNENDQSIAFYNNNNTNNTNNNSKYFDEVNYDSTLGAYSNEDLYKDCERMIQQQYGLKPSSPFRDLKFHLLEEIFISITKYIHQQVENFKSVSINNIGRFSFITSHLNTGNNGIIESKKLVFVMSESFIRDFNLKICKSYRKFVDNSIPTMEVNYFLIAQQCCTRKEIVMLAIRMFRNRLGEIMSTGKKVLIEFNSIGLLKCDKRIVAEFDFIDKFRKPLKFNDKKHEIMKKKFNRIMSREDMKLLNKMREQQQGNNNNQNGHQYYQQQPPQTSRSMIHSSRSSVSGGSIRNPFTIIQDKVNGRPLSSSSIRSYHCTRSISNQQQQQQQHQYARGNGVNAVRNLQNQNYEPHPPSVPRPPPPSTAAANNSISSSQRLTRETLDTFNKMNPNQTILPTDFVQSQFSPSTNYGPYDNGFRQPNPIAAKNVMNQAVKRFEQELESSRRNQQRELDDFYRQLIHNVCANEELRRKKKEEAFTIQNTLLTQMNHTGAKRQIEDHEYCNFFLDERDEDLNDNKNALLMGFKKSKNNERNVVSKSLPSIPSLQVMKPIQKIMLNENNPIEKGLRIPDKNELFDYYNEFN